MPAASVVALVALALSLNNHLYATLTIGCIILTLRITINNLLSTLYEASLFPLWTFATFPRGCATDIAELGATMTTWHRVLAVKTQITTGRTGHLHDMVTPKSELYHVLAAGTLSPSFLPSHTEKLLFALVD